METTKEKLSKIESEFNQAVENYHQALREFVKGKPELQKEMFSHHDDVTLANPFGGVKQGWKQVGEELEHASSLLSEGNGYLFENISKWLTPELALIFEIERFKGKLGGKQDIVPMALRVTTVFRMEDGNWKVLHRHADPLVSAQPTESVIQR